MSRPEPPTRRPIAEFRLTRPVACQWLATAVVAFFAFAYAFGHVLAIARGRTLEPIVVDPAPPFVRWSLVLSLGLVALTVVLHELLHGVFITRYSDRKTGGPTYGIGISYFVLPYAYAETEGTAFTRREMLVVLLAPFVGITALGLVTIAVYPSPALLVPLAANAAGSVGDLWMAATLLRYPSSVRVTELGRVRGAASDEGDDESGEREADESDDRTKGNRPPQGFAIYGPSADHVAEPDSRVVVVLCSSIAVGAVGTLAVLLGATIASVLVSLAVGSGSVVIGDPNGWLLFRHELRSDGGAVIEVGASLVVAVSALGGVCWTGVSAVRGSLDLG
ncbi:DUF3267 domain-containing protein [Halobiforma nitratireducens]|uniref:DUF3267 domain-containing protein n=1 Tax=Halobiforma nitratireducens TaxID=130048 RepID=UPI00067787A8|nr:DUF3267 domain-containing protein [Halobiforma nitratireducens]